MQQPLINDETIDDDDRRERKRGSEAQITGGASASEEPVTKRPMSSTQLSRRWERLSEGRYVSTPDRPKRLAETPLEEHDRERSEGPETLPDLLPLPSDVPRSGRMDIEDIVNQTSLSSSSNVGSSSSAQPAQGSEIQTWLSNYKLQMLPSVESRIRDSFSRNNVDITSDEVKDIAIMSVELAAVDVLELFSLTRFY